MKKYIFLCFGFVTSAGAQPFHTDTTVGGIQTLKVEGDVSVEQYGAGAGGSLDVAGEVRLAKNPVVIPNLPAGVTGYFYGPTVIGGVTTIAEYQFLKTGNDTTGDFVVPLGVFSSAISSGNLQIDIVTGWHDGASGSSRYTLMSKRHRDPGKLTAVSHSSFGGGQGVKLFGWNTHGSIPMFLEYDGVVNYPGEENVHMVIVRVINMGGIDPFNRDYSRSQMFEIELANSFSTPSAWAWGIGPTKHAITTDDIEMNGAIKLNGPVVIQQPQGDISMGIYTSP